MIIRNDPDNTVAEVSNHVCSFHRQFPEIRDYPGCSCSACFSLRKATPEEREENRKHREASEQRREQARMAFGWPTR